MAEEYHDVNCEQPIAGGGDRLFVKFVWCSFGIAVLAWIFGCFDVRDYYAYGRMASLLLGAVEILLELILAIAIVKGKSWARKVFVVFGILQGCAVVFLSLAGELCIETVHDILLLGADIVSAFGAFYGCRRSVREYFLPNSKARGSARAINICQCCLYLLTCFVLNGFVFVVPVLHEGNEPWREDCLQAILRGSKSAKDSMISYFCVNQEGVNEAEAAKLVEDYIKENQQKECDVSGEDSSEFIKKHPDILLLHRDARRRHIINICIYLGMVLFWTLCKFLSRFFTSKTAGCDEVGGKGG
mgnify:CR=1 FL=1